MTPTPQELDRFFQKVVIPTDPDDCWLWIGARSGGGYGYLYDSSAKKIRRAHRIAYRLFNGEVPVGLELDHRCNTPACVNPTHLIATTHRANILRSDAPQAQNARKTHCIHGHPLSGRNLYRPSRGGRQCRRCHTDCEQRRVARLHGRQ